MADTETDRHRNPVLLVEDTDDDVILMQRTLRAARIPNPLVVVHSAEAAMAYLTAALSGNANSPLPAVVFTDLKMPGMTGLELATWIKQHDELSAVRVMVLSSSDHPSDIERAKAAGVDRYLVKFPRPDELSALIGDTPS